MTIYGESFSGASRPDLGPIASAYLQEYGLRPDSVNSAGLLAPSILYVKGSGTVAVPGSEVAIDPDATSSFDWPIGHGTPNQRKPTSRTELTFTLRRVGKEEIWDEDDDESALIRMASETGDGQVSDEEEYHLQESINAMLEGAARKLVALTHAAGDPWSWGEVDCNATKWTAASTAIRTQLASAMQASPWRSYDAALMDNKSWKGFKAASELWSSFGGNVGFGGAMSDAQALVALNNMTGVREVFVLADSLVSGGATTGVVTLYKRGANARREPAGIILAMEYGGIIPPAGPGVEERPSPLAGIRIKSRNEGYAKAIVAYYKGAHKLVPAHGIRLINTHA